MTESKGKFDALVRDDSPITTRKLCTAREIGKPVIMTIIRELGYRKFCATCLPKMFTVEYNTDRRKSICAEIFQCTEKDGNALLSSINISDKYGFVINEPLTRNNKWNCIIRCLHARTNSSRRHLWVKSRLTCAGTVNLVNGIPR